MKDLILYLGAFVVTLDEHRDIQHFVCFNTLWHQVKSWYLSEGENQLKRFRNTRPEYIVFISRKMGVLVRKCNKQTLVGDAVDTGRCSAELLFSRSVMSSSLWSHGLQPAGLPVHHYLLEFAQTHARWVNDAIQPSQGEMISFIKYYKLLWRFPFLFDPGVA